MPDDPVLQIESPRGRQVVRVPVELRRRPLTDLLRRASLPLNTRCGGQGVCDGCVIELLEGSLLHLPSGTTVAASASPRPIRGCEHALSGSGPVSLRLPARALLAYEPQVVTDFSINIPCAHAPLCAPTDAQPAPVGAAIDIGTTTIVVLLVDLTDGRILSRSAAFNQQMHLGDDVVTRITLCARDPGMLRQLQHAVANQTIAPLLRGAAADAGVALDRVCCMTLAGNTTMLHLAAGVDPSSMGTAPFTPTFLDHRILAPRDLFIESDDPPCSSAAAIHLLPGAAAYIGADLTAGALASGLLYDPGPSLLVDAGTNGEIILKHGERLLGCATAAGPAFEGAGLSCGIRAGDGAISDIRFIDSPPRIELDVIGQGQRRPAGLCGSAYIDFLAGARRVGLLGRTGRFARDAIQNPSRLIAWNGGDLAYHLADADGGRPIVVAQRDIAHLLQAKAAIAAGIAILLKTAGLPAREIRRLYLAGGFGTHMNVENAIACGLLPGFRAEQVQPVGNSALAGALVALLDNSALEELARIGRRIEIIELNLDPDFETTYIDQLALP